MYRLLYSCFFYLLIPLVLARLMYRSLREPLYRTAIAERFGCYRKQTPQKVVWVHAVSAGETIAAVPLIRRIVARGYTCLVTHMTPTGRQRVQVLLADEIDKGTVEYCYAPYDLPGSVNRFLDHNEPLALLTIDTELWPNTIAACHSRHIPSMLVNGRLSARSASGYARFKSLTGPMLVAIDLLAVQTPAHRDRFVALGVAPGRIHVTGSIKFDGEYSADHDARESRYKALIGQRQVLLGASTHEGEELALIDAFLALKKGYPKTLLILVPRHTHRTTRVVETCEGAALKVQLFSSLVPESSASSATGAELNMLASETDVLLIDVMGELESVYPFAQLAFVGGSLVPVGGHNLLEAVRAGVPLVMGSNLDNIDDIAAQFIDAKAMKIARDADDLREIVLAMFSSDEQCKAQAQAASRVLETNKGSLDAVEQKIYPLIKAS